LTDVGEIYYRECSDLISRLENTHEEILGRTTEPRGKIRVHSAMGFGQYVLPHAISEFSKLYPKIEIELYIGEFAAKPIDKGVDVVVRSADLPDTSLASVKLCTVHYGIYAAPNFFVENAAPKTPRELQNFNCLIHTGQHPPNVWDFCDGDEVYAVEVKGNLQSNSVMVIQTACEDGAGIARLEEYACTAAVKHKKLIPLFQREIIQSRVLRAFYPRTIHTPARVEIFVKFLQSFLLKADLGPEMGQKAVRAPRKSSTER
jgi:DNA-binding transcriptional LysR family regulator